MVGRYDTRGLRDWIVQRLTAVIIGAYTLFIIAYLVSIGTADFHTIHQLFASRVMRIATIIVVLSIAWHAWIGLWTVFTDYVKCKTIRFILQVLVIILLLGYVIAVADILWG